jgi:undecaprenyl-diphosphatase
MDFMDLVCPMLRMPIVAQFMVAASHFGHGAVGSGAALLFLAHGYAQDNQRSRRAGMALIAALIVTGITTELLKHAAQLPRPYSQASYGFPSGHTSAAFALASVLTVTFPSLGPVFFLLADLTAISRLYFRSNFTWDIL